MDWFNEAKYGLFIHFGLYALLGGEYEGRVNRGNAEWIMNDLSIPRARYERLAEQFAPAAFDAEAIAAAASDWGMRYIVFTAKHHEGYALFDSKAHPYNSVNSPLCGRDLVRELKEACAARGLKLGLYYSQAQDWHDPDGYRYRADNAHKNFRRYLDEKCFPQVRELLSNYGDIALLWFDTPMDMSRAESEELAALVKGLQPDCLINGRIGNGVGDYATMGDNFIPRLPFPQRWEVPATLNDTWGYSKKDQGWKDARQIIRTLVKIAARGGNYLLNVGPKPDGSIPARAKEVLAEVGRYLRANGAAIYACELMPTYPYEISWGDMTLKRGRLYIHVYEPKKVVELLNMKAGLKGARILATGEALACSSVRSCEEDWMLRFEIPEHMYGDSFYCIEAELEEDFPEIEPIRVK